MAKLTTEGVADVAVMFGKAAESSGAMSKMMVYDGARVMADAMRRETMALRLDKERYLQPGEKYAVITSRDRRDLAAHLGITKITYTTSGTRAVIGYAGYGSKKTKKYRNGLPMALLARSLMRGTAVREQSVFIDKAVRSAAEQSQDAMLKVATRELTKIIAE